MAKLPARYQADDAPELIRTTLAANAAVCNDAAIVDKIIQCGKLVFFRQGDMIIQEADQGNEVYFLLSGEVDIVFKSQLGSRREAPNQIGEMAAIELGRKRSASVYASSEEVAALCVPGLEFNKIWNSCPRFQERLQIEMLSRHRERITAGQVARKNASLTWLMTSFGIGVVGGIATWLFMVPQEWTAAAQVSLSAIIGLVLFVLVAMQNPAFFWRRCFLLSLLAMIGTFSIDHFITFEAAEGFGSLEIKVGSSEGAGDWKSTLLKTLGFAFAISISAYMDRTQN